MRAQGNSKARTPVASMRRERLRDITSIRAGWVTALCERPMARSLSLMLPGRWLKALVPTPSLSIILVSWLDIFIQVRARRALCAKRTVPLRLLALRGFLLVQPELTITVLSPARIGKEPRTMAFRERP